MKDAAVPSVLRDALPAASSGASAQASSVASYGASSRAARAPGGGPGRGATGPLLSIRGVSRTFAAPRGGRATVALQETDLDVAENDFITILGPSGCGKSTLLRIVAGLDRQTSGDVLLDGRRIAGPGADRGMVFQS